MAGLIRGIHHVTATVDDAQRDLDFYAGLLGLRLVKKTVNFDNHDVYHFYYGNRDGTPGTIMTTFPYRGQGVAVGQKGAGQIAATAFSVPHCALDFWRERLRGASVAVADGETRFGDETLSFVDPSGLIIELVANEVDERVPWVASGIEEGAAVHGIHSASMAVRTPARSLQLLTEVLGFEVVAETEARTRVSVGADEPGKVLDVVAAPQAPQAINGLGTVHHIAWAVDDADDQLHLRAELVRLGYRVTEVLDRQYFRSIYFREPEGVLFEIATIPPGFAVDEELDDLGRSLKLPPWEELQRSAIEARLPAVTVGGRLGADESGGP